MTAEAHHREARVRGPDAVRARLLTAATELLAQRTPFDVTVRQIAERAGVNHGQIHHYFGSKDGLVAATIADGAARYHQDRMHDGQHFPLPLDAANRPAGWRTLAYLASTGAWRQPPFEPSPVVGWLAHRRADDIGRPANDPEVMAVTAATTALQRGWWIFRDMILYALAPFDPDVDAICEDLATRSMRLVDPIKSEVDEPADVPEAPTVEPALEHDRGPEAVRAKLISATTALLLEATPSAITLKDIATEAGVNHGQVHHYCASKEHLIASCIQRRAAALLASGAAEANIVPIHAERRLPLWRTLAHLAATEEWDHEAYTHSPMVARMVETVAERTGRATTDPSVHGQVVAVHALDLGWGIYRNIIEYGLEPLGGDLVAMRRYLAALSTQLVDPDVYTPQPTRGSPS